MTPHGIPRRSLTRLETDDPIALARRVTELTAQLARERERAERERRRADLAEQAMRTAWRTAWR